MAEAPCGTQRVGSDQLCAMEPGDRQLSAKPYCKGAGRRWFLGDIRRNGEPAPESMPAAAREDPPMTPLEPDQGTQLAPAETGVRAPAGEMHRIIEEEPRCRPFLNPTFRVIVDTKQAMVSGGEAGMVDEGEVMKSKLERHVAQQRAKLWDIRDGPSGFSELIGQPPHCSGRPARNASLCPRAHLLLTCRHRIFVK